MKLKVKMFPRKPGRGAENPIAVGEMEFDADMIRNYGERLNAGGIVEANKWLTEHAEAFAQRELFRVEWKLEDEPTHRRAGRDR